MPRALQIGNDALLMQTRTGLIAEAGLEVLNLVGLAEALVRIPSAYWDAAILCHTLSRADRAAVIAALRRRNPRAPVLLVARRSYMPPGEAAEFDLVLSATPAKMIAALRVLLKQLAEEQEEQEEEEEAG
ncbi:MAG TPA: hypothetical protein VME18_12375 [Acidobacteriaceae bacterium]|nr:hypothetical protein [Acidobacteriaceae bacterium]